MMKKENKFNLDATSIGTLIEDTKDKKITDLEQRLKKAESDRDIAIHEVVEWARKCGKLESKLEVSHDELIKSHDFWRDQCSSYETQLYGKIKENDVLKMRLKPIEECYKLTDDGTLIEFYHNCYNAIKKCMQIKDE